jgi:predicted MFS family arabinose efflux permease
MGWLIAIVALVLLFLFLRKYIEHKVIVVLLVLLFVFLLVSVISINSSIQSNSIDWKSATGIIQIGKVYGSWLGQMFTNLKTITGNAVHLNWQGNLQNNTQIKK